MGAWAKFRTRLKLWRITERLPISALPRRKWTDGGKLHVITFFSEGPPFDNGMNLAGAVGTLRSLVAPHVDSFVAFCPRTLRALPGAQRVCCEYPNEPLLRNKNAEFLGYFDFKPFILLHILSQVPEGDLVLYHDCNLGKYQSYTRQAFSDWRGLCKSLLEAVRGDLFVPYEHPGIKVHMHVKQHTLRTLLPTPELVNACGDRPLINASRVLIRKSPVAEEFLREWLDLATQPHLVGPNPNDDPHPGFMWNCGDQDVLNVLVFLWILRGRLPSSDFPGYYLWKRQLKRGCVKRIPSFW